VGIEDSMQDTRWASFDLIFFDCDSTLSAIEGIDELAKFKGKEQRVGVLTQKAMDGDLGAWFALHPRVTAYANVENLTNRKYEDVAGYPGLKANFRAGFRFRIGGE